MKIKFSKANLKLTIFFIQLLLFSSLNSLAADGVDGCNIVTPGGDIRNYHTPFAAGAGSPTEWVTLTGDPGYSGYNRNTLTRCISPVGPPCTVYLVGSTSSSKTVIFTGTYAILINCPIDDYIPPLLILTIGFAYFRLRNLSLA